MAGFTKLFGSIISSTIWGAADHVRLVWITMLALADQFGRVEASVPGLAHQARVSVDQARDALAILESPDPDSRTPDHEGRRVAKMDGGWRLLNYARYRETKDDEAQRTRNAERQARHRKKVRNAKRNAKRNGLSRTVTQNNPIAEAEAEAEAYTNTLVCVTADDIERIYLSYPRKIAKAAALKAIAAAVQRLDSPDPVAFLVAKTKMFADSEAGNRGRFTPHPATWFNRSSYLDDPKEWERE